MGCRADVMNVRSICMSSSNECDELSVPALYDGLSERLWWSPWEQPQDLGPTFEQPSEVKVALSLKHLLELNLGDDREQL